MRKGDAPHGASPWSYCNGKVLLNQNLTAVYNVDTTLE